MSKLQPVRGTKDLFFEDFDAHEFLINRAKMISELYGFVGIATPIFEFEEVFKRSIGDETDIVSKEMYVLQDRNGENLVLRPEFTAGIVRAFLSNGLLQHLPLKFFSHGPVFRYERPQKGRQRQFHQLNFEAFGFDSPLADSELITMACHFLDDIGVLAKTRLEINSLGSNDSRQVYREKLVSYLSKFENDLSAESKVRLLKNPLRILDSKDARDQEILNDAPKIADSLDLESQDFFAKLLQNLEDANISYHINSKLVRGLDYYCHTAFEFVTEELGAQGTILAGGRYDGLVEIMGGSKTPAVGFAAGMERLAELVKLEKNQKLTVAVVPIAEEFQKNAVSLVNFLRKNGVKTHFDFDVNAVSKRMKKANKIGAEFVVFVDADHENFEVKNMINENQKKISKMNLIQYFGE